MIKIHQVLTIICKRTRGIFVLGKAFSEVVEGQITQLSAE